MKCRKKFEKYKEEYKKFVDKQIIRFEFTKEKFPILANNLHRNWMVHIVERNYVEIKESGGINLFNYIDKNSSREFIENLHKRKATYILDLCENKIILNSYNKNYIADIRELNDEINNIKIKLSNSYKT